MSSEALAKTYDPATVEAQTYRVWLEEHCFDADPAKPGEPYSIVIPPPNVTGALHLGHAINNTLQDILTRLHRMRGFNVVWIPGIDHAGIATQAVVEKQLKENENKTRHDVGREKLVEKIWAWKQQYGDRILSQLQRLGCSCDWTRTRFTLDDMCARAVRETFFKLFKDGLIYRGKRLVNWDTHLLTSISDDELYDEPVKTNLWSIKYPIDGTDDFVVVATTRPETMLADTAVAYHSSNPKAASFKGKSVRLPLTDRLIPLIEDDILVDPEFGTGFVKVTPAHDPNDYAVYQRHLGKPTEIAILNMMTPDGKVNDADPSWSQYTGLTFAAARKKMLEDLTAGGFHNPETDVKPHEANVKFSDRSKTAIQPYLSDQWFVKMAPLAEPALKVVRDGTIKFFPERHAQQYLSWLGEKRDWPISRQLWWGHRIPVWHDPSPKPDAIQWLRLNKDAVHVTETEIGAFVCLRTADDLIQKRMEIFGFVQDPDVLDTWFSSALWPHSTLGWPDQTADLARWYPTSVLMTGRDIITLWVARMVMAGLYNMKEIPFHHVAINPTILDGKGERMSKSKGNGVDPVDIIDTHGADALRFTLTTMATETQDVRMPVKKDSQGRNTSDKFDLGRNFCTKLWNAARFVLSNLESPDRVASATLSAAGVDQDSVAEATLPVNYDALADHWIVSRFNRAVADSNAALTIYRFDQYAKACYDFFWRDFCDWYVEAAKPAFKDPARSAATANVLAAMLDGALRLMHPMIPFITERIWWELNDVRPAGRSIRLILADWPAAGPIDTAAEETFGKLQELIVAIRNIRNEYNIKKSVTVSFTADGELASQILSSRELIETLAVCTINRVEAGLAAPANSARAAAAGIDVFVEDAVDPDAEKLRAVKQIESLRSKIAAHKSRLANPSYAEKAPPHLVHQTRNELAAFEEELRKLGG
jgi:valyl-tRNA synthetase